MTTTTPHAGPSGPATSEPSALAGGESSARPSAAQMAGEFASGERAPLGAAQWASMSAREAVELHRELAAARRRLDASLAGGSAHLTRLSKASDGEPGLARREGYANPTQLVAAATGGSPGEAGRLIAVGETMLGASEEPRARNAEGSPPAPPRFAHVAKAVNEGALSIDAAGSITAMLTRVAGRIEDSLEAMAEGEGATDAEAMVALRTRLESLVEVERHLVQRARTLPFNKLVAVVRQAQARLDFDLTMQREEQRRDSRYLNVFENREGMVVVDGRLDPETAAPLRAALDGMVADVMRRKRDLPASEQDGRSPMQMRADALADLARHTLGCDAKDLPLSKVTVVVRAGLEELRTGVGLGQIDGTDQPVSAGTIRRMAADAEVIPVVLGTNAEVLDVGRSKRFFTRAQRVALVERDGGCAFCHAPPSYAEAHHIKWWHRDHGRTSVSNGVMLCTTCHHRIHRDQWEISVRDGTVWFVPPPSVDPQQQPRPGGRKQFEFTETDMGELRAAA